jgi:hypothetical protein
MVQGTAGNGANMRSITPTVHQRDVFRWMRRCRSAWRCFSVALVLPLVWATLPVPLLTACQGQGSSAGSCTCEETCSCCAGAVPADAPNEQLHGAVRTHGCMACMNGRPSIDRVVLVPFAYRGMLLDHSGVAAVDARTSTTGKGSVCMVRPQSNLSEVPLFLRVCSLLS